MIRYTLWRLAQTAVTLLLSSVLVFSLIRSIPGDPAELLDGPQATPSQLAATAKALGLTSPVEVQYFNWLSLMLHGQFGNSLVADVPVSSLVARAFVPTLWLLLGAMTVALVVGVGLGFVGAATKRKWLDTSLGGLMALLYGAPSVFIGLLSIWLFAVRLHWLPPEGFVNPFTDPPGGLKALLLPSIVLGLSIAGIEARFVRSALGEAMTKNYVLAARAKGASRQRTLYVHAARSALIPVITTYGLNFAYLLGGAVAVEVIFTWPGIGNLLNTAISTQDYPTMQALLMIFVVTFAVVNLLTDLLYAAVDPRIRRSIQKTT
jgi:ABC-type dipeptide/oligopeptide/nickel transport system permease component